MKKIALFVLLLASTSAFAQTTTDSATASRYMAGAGFDYEGKNTGGIVKDVPTAPKAVSTTPIMANNPNTVNLGGGSHTVDIIDKKNTAMPSLKQKEMPKFPEKPERYRGGIDYAPPKTKPVSVLPKTPGQPSGKALPEPNSLEPWKDVPKFGPQSDEPTPATRKIQENTVIRDPSLIKPTYQKKEQQNDIVNDVKSTQQAQQKTANQLAEKTDDVPQTKPAVQPKSVTQPVAAKPQPVDPNLPTGPSIRTKEMPLPGQEPLNVDKGVTQQAKQPITDRAAGAHEIFELHEGNAIQKSKPLNEQAGRWTKPLKEDDWKYPEKPVQPTAEQEKQVPQQKPVATKQKPQKEPEQKTVIKKMDPNKKWGEFKPIYPPSESAQKIKKMDTSKWKKDPFASDRSLDSKYERRSSGNSRFGRRGASSYGDESDIALQRQAIANKESRLAREQAQKDAEAAAMAGMLTDGMMNATISHIDAKNAKKHGGSSSGYTSSEPTVYRSRGYADTLYSREENYNAPDPNKSATWNKAKGMTGGSGW